MPAIRSGVPFETYCKIDAVNWSSLKHIGDSPLHYRDQLTRPAKVTPSLLKGRVTHTLLLEPTKLESKVAVWKDGDRRGSAWKEFAAANAGRDVVKESEITECRTMAACFDAHPLVRPYRVGARYELTVTWTDEATGIRCKARPDWLVEGPDGLVLLDVKTTRSVDARSFGWDAKKMGYARQFAHYVNGLTACGSPPVALRILAVENTRPYDVGVFQITPDQLATAQADVAMLLERLKACRQEDRWPGRHESEKPLELPEPYDSEPDVTYEEEEAP